MSTSASGRGAIIGGFGMVASLGYDAATICAAARAGLVRPAVQPGFRIRSAVEGDEEPVVGHQATLLTQGFEGRARLVRLAQGALTDLKNHTAGIDWPATPHRFYVAMADPARTRGAEVTSADPARDPSPVELRMAGVAGSAPLASMLANAQSFLSAAAALANWPVPPSVAFVSLAGRTGALRAMQAAIADLSSGVVQVAVVLAVDSLLDEDTMSWLHAGGRLKCDSAPAGLQPGEAAVALGLCGDGNDHEGRSILVGPVAVAAEARNFAAGQPPVGEGLAAAIGTAWSGPDDAIPWILCDQNGEYYRATDWGFASVRLRARSAAFASPVLWYPAVSVGDTGAAASLVATCFAVHAWERGYAPAGAALVTACDDGEGRCALMLFDAGTTGAP